MAVKDKKKKELSKFEQDIAQGKVKVDEQNNIVEIKPPPSKVLEDDDSINVDELISAVPHCFLNRYWLLVFVVTSMINAGFCIAYLCNEIPIYVFGKGGFNWKSFGFGLLYLLTAFRIVVQIGSAVDFYKGLRSSNMKKTYKCVMRYINAGLFVAKEQLFSVILVLTRIFIETMPENEIMWKFMYAVSNFIDIALFSWGFMFYLCFAEIIEVALNEELSDSDDEKTPTTV